jgi:hypothetical protein
VAFGGRADGPGPAAEVPELARNAHLREEPDAVRAARSRSKAIQQANYAILVEGYFDLAQLLQAGIGPVVASCGTALTPQQAHLLGGSRRKWCSASIPTPRAGGRRALVRPAGHRGLQRERRAAAARAGSRRVRARMAARGTRSGCGVAALPGVPARTAAREHELTTDEGRRTFLQAMLTVAARIPDAAARDQFADRLAHRTRITEEVVRAEIRKAAVARRTVLTDRELPPTAPLKPAERGLVWNLVHDPGGARRPGRARPGATWRDSRAAAVRGWRGRCGVAAEQVPDALLERLTEGEARLVTGIAADATRPAPVGRRLRVGLCACSASTGSVRPCSRRSTASSGRRHPSPPPASKNWGC